MLITNPQLVSAKTSQFSILGQKSKMAAKIGGKFFVGLDLKWPCIKYIILYVFGVTEFISVEINILGGALDPKFKMAAGYGGENGLKRRN